jgi:hypothetical protein
VCKPNSFKVSGAQACQPAQKLAESQSLSYCSCMAPLHHETDHLQRRGHEGGREEAKERRQKLRGGEGAGAVKCIRYVSTAPRPPESRAGRRVSLIDGIALQ